MMRLLLLLSSFFVYSLSAVLSKYASQSEFLSSYYLLFFGGVVVSLGIYAVLWQKVLAFMPLNKAFLCKSATIVIILSLSSILFDEVVTLSNVVGSCFILLGLALMAWNR